MIHLVSTHFLRCLFISKVVQLNLDASDIKFSFIQLMCGDELGVPTPGSLCFITLESVSPYLKDFLNREIQDKEVF